jgi:hypothetical protein
MRIPATKFTLDRQDRERPLLTATFVGTVALRIRIVGYLVNMSFRVSRFAGFHLISEKPDVVPHLSAMVLSRGDQLDPR